MSTVARMRELLPAMLDDVRALVTCESPSEDPSALARSAATVARVGRRLLGAEPERIAPAHLRWRFGQGPARVLALGHHDTVWPAGSLGTHPCEVHGEVLRGPGCFDMKAGLVVAMYAIAALPDRSGVTLLVTGDEEIGSVTSRPLIETEAAGCAAALVFEAAGPGGALKTQRKGVSGYRVRVTGRAAHAGLEPERGVNAAVEVAHQVLAVSALADAARGTTVTPTVLSAGTTRNTVPATAELGVDVRATDGAEQQRVDRAMRALRPLLPGARVEVTAEPSRPPLPARSSAGLFARAQELATALGLPPLTGTAVGGGSDGNFTAAVGTPTLDGLGAVGGGAHADDEHVLVAELPVRAALAAALITGLLAEKGTPR
ncbi:M20 family metallopeptidase [Micromonosporaceae bacterium B7E4]